MKKIYITIKIFRHLLPKRNIFILFFSAFYLSGCFSGIMLSNNRKVWEKETITSISKNDNDVLLINMDFSNAESKRIKHFYFESDVKFAKSEKINEQSKKTLKKKGFRSISNFKPEKIQAYLHKNALKKGRKTNSEFLPLNKEKIVNEYGQIEFCTDSSSCIIYNIPSKYSYKAQTFALFPFTLVLDVVTSPFQLIIALLVMRHAQKSAF